MMLLELAGTFLVISSGGVASYVARPAMVSRSNLVQNRAGKLLLNEDGTAVLVGATAGATKRRRGRGSAFFPRAPSPRQGSTSLTSEPRVTFQSHSEHLPDMATRPKRRLKAHAFTS